MTLAVIIFGGFLLRFYSLYVGQAYTYFAINDEVTALQYALGFLAGDQHMLYLGSPALNQGNLPGPLWAMLVAGLYKIGGSTAEGAIFGMVILNTLAIYLVYRLARVMMPNRYALFSTLLYSFSAWGIYYSAGLYNPFPLALLGALLFLALWQTTQADHSRNIFWVCLLAAGIPQFHMIGIFYYPAILLLLIISPARINRRYFVAGVLAGIALYMPYVIGEIQHHWQNTQLMLTGDRHFSAGTLKVISTPIAMLTNHPGQWAGRGFEDFKQFGDACFGSYILLLIVNLISLTLALIVVIRFMKRLYRSIFSGKMSLRERYQQHSTTLFTGILLVLPLLLYTFTGKAYATRYSIIIFPLLFLLPGLVIQHMANRSSAWILTRMFLAMTAFNICMVVIFYNYQSLQLKTSSAFMPSFRHLAKIKTSFDSVIGKGQRVEISFSDEIQKLPEGQWKLYKTIPAYLAIYQNPSPVINPATRTRRFKVLSADETMKSTRGLIYTSAAINIIEITHAGD